MNMNWVTIHIECLKLEVKIDIAIMKRSPTVNVPIEPHPGKTHKGSKGKRHGGGHDHQTVFSGVAVPRTGLVRKGDSHMLLKHLFKNEKFKASITAQHKQHVVPVLLISKIFIVNDET